MRREYVIDTDELVKLGSKREWVPMWLWVNLIFRFGLYEIWPLGYILWTKAGVSETTIEESE